ncbi:hypothetical protein GCM10023189_38910 [Nibrella saemangeumensis]|uniref:N-acetyltransferase domain-containing protein n=1 Tax=Nibrella saemangeumensis TaxID=1084526 RepID=A0ABP8N9Q3_9BACT
MKLNVFAISRPAILYQDGPLRLTVASQADEQAILLLQQTTYGTKGIRYRQTGQENKIHQLNNPYFFHLYQGDELVGIYCLDQRMIGFPFGSVSAFYGRYLTVRDKDQCKGYGQLLKSRAVDYIHRQEQPPYLFYSFIEAKNTRSMAVSTQEDFESVAQLKTYMFRRYSPVKDTRFREASTIDPARTLHLVQQQFAGYGFQNFININYNRQYFTLEEDGRIIAGVQANPIVWQLVHIPGPFGTLIGKVAPFIPGLRRFFNPSRQAFVVLEGVYVEKGRPELLPVLLESVLAHFNIHTAMWQIDQKDPLITLLPQKKMGLFSQFQPEVTTHVMVKAVDLPNDISLGQAPVYMSCFDYS